ncbi:hypothetical protein [Niallia sp. Krafla_26]|uniref:hypothetical protein n=1 Tax=Niallia sp. Krafla_26 TaxID=3064703 RepID=UPI003D177DA6
MYPYHFHADYYHPYDPTSETTYYSEYDVPEFFDDRSFPSFPSPGGPMGPPPGPPGFPGQGGGQGAQSGPPSAPPPTFVPAQTQQQQAGTFAVDPGSIRGCLFRYTYIWLRNREQFWFYPTFVGRTSVSGWRWTGYRWVFFGTSLRQVQSFTCV